MPEWSDLDTDFLGNLNRLGLDESDIDIVVCTHMHCDHVGWNAKLENGKWVPTFPNAKYVFVRQEYEYWKQKPEKEIGDDRAGFEDSIRPIVEASLAEFVESDYRIDKNLRFIPTTGHTPGHVSLLIKSNDQRAIISGDIIHHPCQIGNPEWAAFDTFPDKAKETRHKVLKEIADTDTLLIGSHFSNPVAGHVVTSKNGYMFVV